MINTQAYSVTEVITGVKKIYGSGTGNFNCILGKILSALGSLTNRQQKLTLALIS